MDGVRPPAIPGCHESPIIALMYDAKCRDYVLSLACLKYDVDGWIRHMLCAIVAQHLLDDRPRLMRRAARCDGHALIITLAGRR